MKAKKKKEEMIRIEKEMEAMRIKKEEEERRRQYNEEKERIMGEVRYPSPQLLNPALVKPDEIVLPSQNLYPSNQVPAVIHETNAAAKY